jgi:hypothetical protein
MEESGSVLVIEILEYQHDVEDIDACSYFMEDLVGDSESDDDDDESSGEDGVMKQRPIRHRRKRRAHTTIGDGRVIDLLPRRDDYDKNDDVGGGDATSGSPWFRDFTVPQMEVGDASTNDSGSTSPPRRLVACIARGSRVEEADDEDDPDGRGRIVVDVDVCVMRLGIVGADVLITLSTPRNGIIGGIGNATEGGLPSNDLDGPFRRVLKTFDVKDWGLFDS